MAYGLCLLICVAAVVVRAQDLCEGKPDGPCCAGCQSYRNCSGGKGVQVDCPLPHLAYNSLIRGCDRIENTPPPCGHLNDCSQLRDGKYPDMTPGQECRYFFTCQGGKNLGNTPCNPPGYSALVFNFDLQLCDWITNVPPPCGPAQPSARRR